jgi:hypothetical protein
LWDALAHSWWFLLLSIATIIGVTGCLVEVYDEAKLVDGRAKEIRWGSQPFPKDEVLAMLKDAHTCINCYWERGTGKVNRQLHKVPKSISS